MEADTTTSLAELSSSGQGTIDSRDIPLFWQGLRPDRAQGAVIIVHGVGEHSGRYDALAQRLADANIACYRFDLRGFGRSGGPRADLVRWEDYLFDVRAMCEFVRRIDPDLPIALFGHSLGALIVLDYAARLPKGIRGVAINGVPLVPGQVGSPMLIAGARILNALMPTRHIDLRIDPETISSLPEEVQRYRDDPLIEHHITIRLGVMTLEAIKRLQQQTAMALPLLITHGAEDRLNLPQGSQALFDRLDQKDKAFKLYPGNRHEVHHDRGADEFTEDLIDWFLPRLSRRGDL